MFLFDDCWSKVAPKTYARLLRFRPESPQKRSQNASAMQPLFFIDLESNFDNMLMILASVLVDLETILTIFCWYRHPYSHNFGTVGQVSPISPAFCQYLALNRFGSNPSSYHMSFLLKSPIVLGCGGDALRLQLLLRSLLASFFHRFS